MTRIICLLLLATLGTAAPAIAQDASSDRVKQLEEQNKSLQRDLDAAKARIRELEGGTRAPTPPPPAARSTQDPGSDPWGNPSAALRTLASKVKEDLLAKGQSIPDSAAGEKIIQSYRQRVSKWIESMAKFRQPVEWRVDVSEAILASSSPREFEVRMHALNADGAHVGQGFTVKCPATASPDLTIKNAPGVWVLKADVVPSLHLNSEITSTDRANPFGETPLIAPQLECRLNFVVHALTRAVDATPVAPAAPNGK
jgi:hypothetical protein